MRSYHICLRLCLGFFMALAFHASASAHEIRPSIADLQFQADGTWQAEILVNLEALLARIGPEHADTNESPNADRYNTLRAMAPDQLVQEYNAFQPTLLNGIGIAFDGTRQPIKTSQVRIAPVGDTDFARDTTITVSGAIPAGAQSLTWSWDESFGTSAIRITNADGTEGYSAFLQPGTVSEPIPVSGGAAVSGWDVFKNYVVIGYEHIVPKGLDHILFVVGLFLLSPKLAPLLWQISAFTVAHTITLALGMLGIVKIAPSIVEPLIAASIVYVGVENIMTSTLHRWRPVIVFLFGLLHGLGFAGVLTDIGLQSGNFITGLIAFNIGVELGQLSVIAVCFLLVGYWFGKKDWYHRYVTIPASLAISVIAAWWFYERVFLA
jgi:hydrogenase/urease accessory protein HupE